MLVLTRYENESIMINNDIEIFILKINKGKFKSSVSIGIEAPKNVPIHRKEIFNLIQKENENEQDNLKLLRSELSKFRKLN